MPHPNEMAHWAEIACQRGCTEHATRTAHINLAYPHGYRDWTEVPARFGYKFNIEVWDTLTTPVDGGPYCPARDAVSETILSHGIWEPAETVTLLSCFEARGRGWFIDFGSQIGWYSVLAARSGFNVIAFDADADCIGVTRRNLEATNLSFETEQARVGPGTEPFLLGDGFGDMSIIAKIDLEGAEADAVRMLQPLIDADRVEYLLIEISPVFNDSYLGLAQGLISHGFEAYEMPDKSVPPHQITGLESLRPFHLSPSAIDAIPTWHQKNVLFALGGLG